MPVVRAPASETSVFGICANCYTKFQLWLKGKGDETDINFNRWLVRRLYIDLRRLKQFGISGRCEVISSFLYGNRGFQCALPAIAKRDGHRVCASHVRSIDAEFVDGEQTNFYDVVRDLLRELAQADTRFRQMINEALAEYDTEELAE